MVVVEVGGALLEVVACLVVAVEGWVPRPGWTAAVELGVLEGTVAAVPLVSNRIFVIRSGQEHAVTSPARANVTATSRAIRVVLAPRRRCRPGLVGAAGERSGPTVER